MSAISEINSYFTQTTSTSLSLPSQVQRKILLICQGNLNFYRETLFELDPDHISVVTLKDAETLSSKDIFNDIHFVDEYFSSGEVERICFEILKKKDFKLIIATSETDILRAAKLRDLFLLSGQSSESALFFRDKIRMKKLLKQEGIEVPKFTRVKCALDVLSFLEKNPLPVIIKPARGYGSLQTRVLREPKDVKALLDTKGIFDEFQSADFDLETFIPTDMYHVDGIVRDGQVVVIWPSKCINNCLQMVEGKPTGGYLLGLDNPFLSIINDFAIKVLRTLPAPTDYGFHLELFIQGEKPIFCEIASRIGGPWINDLWVNGMGIDLKKEFVRAQAALPFSASSTQKRPSKLIGGMIFPPKKGKVLSIPNGCNLKGVIQYSPLVRIGTQLENPQGMLGHIAAFTVSANSEFEMIETIESVQKWVQEHIFICDKNEEGKQ